jgi:hypothetical protein
MSCLAGRCFGMYMGLDVERSRVRDAIPNSNYAYLREGTQSADFDGVTPWRYGGGSLWQKNSPICHASNRGDSNLTNLPTTSLPNLPTTNNLPKSNNPATISLSTKKLLPLFILTH